MRKIVLLVSLSLAASCGVKNSPKTQTLSGSDPVLVGRLVEINENIVATGSFSMTMQARLNPPMLNSLRGQSTSIDIHNNKSYVSFNVKGPANQMGAVTVIDTSSAPIIEKEIRFLDQDVNYVRYSNNAYNIVGAKQSTPTNKNAYFQQFTVNSLNNNIFVFDKEVPSFAANHLNEDNSYFYVSSGDVNGGLSVFNKTNNALKFYSQIQDSRSVGIPACGKEVNVLTGSNSKVLKFSKNKIDTLSTATGSSTAYSGATEQEARSEIFSGVDYSLVSLGEAGFKVICNEDMSVKATIAAPVRAGVAQGDIRTNGLSSQKGLIFAAQGGAGLSIYSFKKVGSVPAVGCQNVSVTEIAATTLTAYDSVNSVSSLEGKIYTSNGAGGVEIFSYTKTAENDDVEDFDKTYQTATCQARAMISDCDSVKMLSAVGGLITVPAKANDKECYALKIVNYQSNKTSSSYPDRLAGLLVNDHDSYVNKNPRIMSHTLYSIKMLGNRDLLVSGSKYGLSSFYVDNFIYFKLSDSSSVQHYGTGTQDSAAIGSSSPLVNNGLSTYVPVLFDAQAPSGIANYSSALLLSSKLNVPLNTLFSLDSYALDAGSVGETSDMYLIFR